jgi:hypothetical protein
VIYALDDMGYDGDLGKWIAQTIPEVIEPGSWNEKGVLRYYAPKNILIVNHSEKVQKKVDGFLKNLKSSLPKTRDHHTAANTPRHLGVVPAAHRVQVAQHPPTDPLLLPHPGTEPSAYPVPPPVKAPKHLFHFLIRYEGEGIIDDNVVRFFKAYSQAEAKGKSDKEEKSSKAPVAEEIPTLPSTITGRIAGSPLAGEKIGPPKEKKADKKPVREDEEP